MSALPVSESLVSEPQDYAVVASAGGFDEHTDTVRFGRHWLGKACQHYRNLGYVQLSITPVNQAPCKARHIPFPRSLQLGVVVDLARRLYWRRHAETNLSQADINELDASLVLVRIAIHRHVLIDQLCWNAAIERRHAETLVDEQRPDLYASIQHATIAETDLT